MNWLGPTLIKEKQSRFTNENTSNTVIRKAQLTLKVSNNITVLEKLSLYVLMAILKRRN